ncbi:hypothetical protein [Pigmentiphaga daeguensis]|uniref:Uncharacterized protein n=1 Tax=Pigmentiphaga daeguensis TaxID=414049 RepID=A0ABN1D2G7_9BURK
MDKDDNGILGQLHGEAIAQATNALPDPATATDLNPSVLITVERVGRVRIRFVRKQARRAKHSHYFWAATRAERVSSSAPADPT